MKIRINPENSDSSEFEIDRDHAPEVVLYGAKVYRLSAVDRDLRERDLLDSTPDYFEADTYRVP